MNEVIKEILSRFRGTAGFVTYTFPYFRNGSYDTNSCKEVGCRFEIWTDAIVIGLNSKNAESKLENFKKLSLACEIPIKENDFELATINKNTWLIIRGWWARNILRRELCRLIIKSGDCSKIEDVVNGWYAIWFQGRPALKPLFSSEKFKNWVTSIRNFKVDKTRVSSGLFLWVDEGSVKL